MCAQRSNREALIEGTLRCLERLPAEAVTARAIAAEADANLGSIAYHFGSKEALVTAAVVHGLDRWLAEIAAALDAAPVDDLTGPLARAAWLAEPSSARHAALARTLAVALARAPHDASVRELLAEGFRHTRPAVAHVLGLGADGTGEDAAGLAHAMFVGLLLQALLDPALAITGPRMDRAQARLGAALTSAVEGGGEAGHPGSADRP